MKPTLFKSRDAFTAFLASVAGTGRLLHTMVMHDDGCSPSRCTCEPWYEVRDLTVETMLEGQAEQDKWIKGSSS